MMKRIPVLLCSLLAAGCATTPPLPANVTLAPDPMDFGRVFVGDTRTLNAVLTNGTANALQVRSSVMGPGTVFGQTPPALPAPLAAGATMNFPLTFTPPSKGAHQGTWHLTLTRRPYAASLQGEGVLFVFDDTTFGVGGSATPADGLDFGDVVVGQTKELEITMRNIVLQGPPVVFPAAPALAPAGPPFSVRSPAGAHTVNAPPQRSKVDIKVVFAPTAVGRFTAVLTWTDNAGLVRIKAQVSGNGIAAEGQ
jgi:hypothetical protein